MSRNHQDLALTLKNYKVELQLFGLGCLGQGCIGSFTQLL